MAVDVLGDLARALDAVCEADPATLADGESLVVLHRQLERLEAVVTRAAAAFDAGGTWEADGARTAAAWLATRCRLPVALASGGCAWGGPCGPWAGGGGVAGGRHRARPRSTLLARPTGRRTADCFERDEAMLVEPPGG